MDINDRFVFLLLSLRSARLHENRRISLVVSSLPYKTIRQTNAKKQKNVRKLEIIYNDKITTNKT